jgi:hypothetical protein
MTDTTDLDFEDEVSLATGSAYVKQDDLENCLLLLRPYEQGTRPSKNDSGKEYVWVECDVVVLQTGPDGFATDRFADETLPLEIEGLQMTGQNVTGQLIQKMRRNKKALGVLELGEATRNRNAPWYLNPPTQGQLDVAKAYVRKQAAAAEKAEKTSKPFD